MSQKAYTEQKKVRILRKENGLNFKLKHRKAQKSILPGGFGDPYGRTGDQCRIRETYGWSDNVSCVDSFVSFRVFLLQRDPCFKSK